MKVGDAKIEISAEDKASAKMKGVERSMDSMGKQMAKTGAIMVAAGAAIMAGIWKMADSYTKAGDEVAKMAKRTGFSTESLSELRHATKLSGSSIQSFEKGVKRMASTVEDAKDGLETYVRSFDKLGLSVDEVAAMAPEEQFWAIAEALAELEDATMRSALAQDFFGRAGTDLLPMLAAGKEGIAAMRQEAHDLGVVFDEEAAAECEHFQDSITKLKTVLAGLVAAFIDDVLPTLEKYIERAMEIIKNMKAWTAEHPKLAEGLLTLAGILVVGGALMLGLAAFVNAIRAISSALFVMHALSGPKGWLLLAGSIGVAAGALGGFQKLMGEEAWWERMPKWVGALHPLLGLLSVLPDIMDLFMGSMELPKAQFGGIVPGPIGQPVPILAHGGELVSGLHGEAMGGTTVNINVGSYLGDESSLREFVRTMKDIFNQDIRRTSFAGINTLGYFPGSSAP